MLPEVERRYRHLPPARLSPTAEARYYYYVTAPALRRGIRERDLVPALELESLDIPGYRDSDKEGRVNGYTGTV